MTPAKTDAEQADIDNRLAILTPHEAALSAAHDRYVVAGDERMAAFIERGPGPDEGLPADLAGAFAQGLPGLHASQREIARLEARRALLDRQRPSAAAIAATEREAQTSATTIRARAQDLDRRIADVRAAVEELAALAFDVTHATWELFCANNQLDVLCGDAGIARPETPRRDAPSLPLAMPLSLLLQGHYSSGGRPHPVDSMAARELRAAQERIAS